MGAKTNNLRTIRKLQNASEIRGLLVSIIYKERELIKTGNSNNYDALSKVERQLINLSRDIQNGLNYIRINGEQPN